MIEIVNDGYTVDQKAYHSFIKKLIAEVSLKGNVTVKIGDETESRSLNKQFRSKDYPTDVLSFPVNEMMEDLFYAGDIFICYPVLQKQALEYDRSEWEELLLLTIHGVLHLAGYDHESDQGEMLEVQSDLFQKLNRS